MCRQIVGNCPEPQLQYMFLPGLLLHAGFWTPQVLQGVAWLVMWGNSIFLLGVKHKVPLVRFESQISRENLRLKSGSWVDISCLSRPPKHLGDCAPEQ